MTYNNTIIPLLYSLAGLQLVEIIASFLYMWTHG